MYICVCKGITEEQLKRVVSSGHKGKDALKKLGVGDDCGVCLLDKIEALRNLKKESKK